MIHFDTCNGIEWHYLLKSGSATCYSIITAQDDNDMMYHDLSSLAAAVAGRRSLSGD